MTTILEGIVWLLEMNTGMQVGAKCMKIMKTRLAYNKISHWLHGLNCLYPKTRSKQTSTPARKGIMCLIMDIKKLGNNYRVELNIFPVKAWIS